jgi:glycosyltransferase involved in cell wall biosynthesis
MRMQGPYSPALTTWLSANAARFDCVVFICYLYWTTWAGLRAVRGAVPTLLHPTAHDEPPLRLSLFDEVFRSADAFAFLSPEERDLVARRFPSAPGGDVVGVGVELPDESADAAFRQKFGMNDDPYFLYVGRVDPAKGAAELLDYFVTYKDRNPGPERMVFLGEPFMEFPDRADIIATGFVDAAVRDSALSGARALVQPSYFESFSMVLTEAFAHRRPALVQGRCAVLKGHAHRSGAAIPYVGYAEFEAAVQLLSEDATRADAMGERGREYVAREYDWDVVLDKYEKLLKRQARAA